MKIALAAVAALAASASAIPLRVISFTGSPELLQTFEHPHLAEAEPLEAQSWQDISRPSGFRPCHGSKHATPPSSYLSGPLGALLSNLGFAPRERGQGGRHHAHVQMEVVSAVRDEEQSHRGLDAWKTQVEEMIHDIESKAVPLMEGGMVQILPMIGADGSLLSETEVSRQQAAHVRPSAGEWKAMEGKNGVKAHHHHHHHDGMHQHGGNRHGRSFGCRLNHALKALRPVESLSLAFVLGAGIGSILHFFFMLLLLSVRRLRGPRMSREERREARRVRRAERQTRRAIKKAGRAPEENEAGQGEALPSYAEGNQDPLLEKA